MSGVVPFVVRDRAGQTSSRFGACQASGAPVSGPGLPASQAARGDVGPGVALASGRVRQVLDEAADADLSAAIQGIRRAMASPGLTMSERKALGSALSTVAGVARVRLERRERAVDRRMLQTPRGDR